MTALMKTEGPEWPAYLQKIVEHYQDLDDAAIKKAISERLNLTAENLAHLAVLFKIARAREIDTADIARTGIGRIIQRIASGQLLPEVAAKFSGCGLIARKVGSLPLELQRSVANDDPIPVTVMEDDGATHRLVRPSQMDERQAHQVFASDHIRDESEQRTYLETMRNKEPRATAGPYVIDKRKGVVRFTQPVTLTRIQITDILRGLG